MCSRFCATVLVKVLFVIVFGISGLFNTHAQAAAEPEHVVFGVSLDLTGSHAHMSAMQKKGFLLWEKHVNAAGGILGRQVQVSILDNQGCLEKLYDHYQQMLSTDKADFVFGPYSSAHTETVVPLFEEYKIPVLASGASAPSLWEHGYKYLFGLYSPADQYAQGFLEIMSMRNIRNIAMINSPDIFSRSAAQGALQWAQRLGMNITIFEEVELDFDEFVAVAARAREKDAQALMKFGYFEASVMMRRAILDADYKPAAYYSTVGPVSDAYYENLRELSENTFSTAIWRYHSNLVYPGVHRFNADFELSYGQAPNYHAATAYAAGQLMVRAMETSGSFDLQQLREVLAQKRAFTVLGRYGVNYRGAQIRHVPFTVQWQRGQQEIVWPPSLSTSQPRLEYGR